MRVSLDADEAWAIFRYVRLSDQLGREHDWEQAQRLHAALLFFRDNPISHYELELDDAFARWITRQVSDLVMVGTTYVGRNILLKVMVLLAEPPPLTEDTEPRQQEVGEPYQASFRKDDEALAQFDRYLSEREVES